ncbi:hypothetical protein Pelo_15830 [Pelomyxa schiedti]|nr:hypothetical protein Pelo_15830 [Pelomyxa schiedti]
MKEYIGLENLIYGFKHPSILDLKMGTQTWHTECSPAKKAFHMKQDQLCTTTKWGFRFCGMRVYNGTTKTFKSYDKHFGWHALERTDLLAALAVFFGGPCPTSTFSTPTSSSTPPPTTTTATACTTSSSSSSCSSSSSPSDPLCCHSACSALTGNLRCDVIRSYLRRLADVEEFVCHSPWHFYASSLVFVYDADDVGAHPPTIHMVDFAHADEVPGAHGDQGYCHGLSSLSQLLRSLLLCGPKL